MSERSAQFPDASLPVLARPGGYALIPLFIFVALIPVEEALSVSGVGTLSRGVAVVFALLYVIPRIGRITLRAMPLAGWAFVEWAFVSTIWSINANIALTELSTLIQLFAIAVLIADVIVHDPGLVRPLLWTYSISAAFLAALGFLAFLQGNRVANDRVVALAGQDPAHFAALLLPAFIFCTVELVRGRRPYLSLSVVLISLAGILLSGTRGAWVSMVVALALFVFPALDLRRKVGAVILLVVVFGAVLQIPSVSNLVVDRVATAGASGGAGRTDIWKVGVEIFETSPVIGVGYANFPVAYTPKMVMEAGVGLSYQGAYRAPHNLVVSLGAELGLVGLGLFALLLVPLVLRRGWGPDAQVIRAILTAFMVDALFLDLFGNRKQVWLIIGIAAGLAYLARRAGSADEEADAADGLAVAVEDRPPLDHRRPPQRGGRPAPSAPPGSMIRGDS